MTSLYNTLDLVLDRVDRIEKKLKKACFVEKPENNSNQNQYYWDETNGTVGLVSDLINKPNSFELDKKVTLDNGSVLQYHSVDGEKKETLIEKNDRITKEAVDKIKEINQLNDSGGKKNTSRSFSFKCNQCGKAIGDEYVSTTKLTVGEVADVKYYCDGGCLWDIYEPFKSGLPERYWDLASFNKSKAHMLTSDQIKDIAHWQARYIKYLVSKCDSYYFEIRKLEEKIDNKTVSPEEPEKYNCYQCGKPVDEKNCYFSADKKRYYRSCDCGFCYIDYLDLNIKEKGISGGNKPYSGQVIPATLNEIRENEEHSERQLLETLEERLNKVASQNKQLCDECGKILGDIHYIRYRSAAPDYKFCTMDCLLKHEKSKNPSSITDDVHKVLTNEEYKRQSEERIEQSKEVSSEKLICDNCGCEFDKTKDQDEGFRIPVDLDERKKYKYYCSEKCLYESRR